MNINGLRNIKASFVSCVLLCASLCTVWVVQAEENQQLVSVQINQQSYQFVFANNNLAPRLVDVLAPVALTENWYWPAAALYNTDDNTAQLLQQQVLQQLADLQQDYSKDVKLQQALTSMASQIKSWQLATRVFIPIDYDFARARAALNPRLTSGSYQLQLYTRPTYLTVLGLVQQPGKVAYKNASNVSAYVADVTPLAAADSSIIYLLQPDGRMIKTSVKAWRQDNIEAMPGAQLFVPFKPALFSAKWQQLNQNILALARHRVLA